ncbi:MAG: NADPH-dependent oxidoreductase [Actinomycetaceae bacterium]|nr:NADPH-dependent oxidoreductase [Actinomycetaceae bacterium]
MTNPAVQTLLDHRTIREFDPAGLEEETVQTIFDVAMRTSTSRGFQHAALIRVKDQDKRDAIAEIANQAYIARAPELIIAIVDARRSVRILEEKGLDPTPATSIDVFREGYTDAVLMVQNMTAAAEIMGLGATHLGSVYNHYGKLIEILELPKYTFPVLGLIVGKPAQEPQLKPRMPKELRVMTDVYTEPESWLEALEDYDAEMTHYYDTRTINQRSDTYTNQIVSKVGVAPERLKMHEYMRSQGFTF